MTVYKILSKFDIISWSDSTSLGFMPRLDKKQPFGILQTEHYNLSNTKLTSSFYLGSRKTIFCSDDII